MREWHTHRTLHGSAGCRATVSTDVPCVAALCRCEARSSKAYDQVYQTHSTPETRLLNSDFALPNARHTHAHPRPRESWSARALYHAPRGVHTPRGQAPLSRTHCGAAARCRAPKEMPRPAHTRADECAYRTAPTWSVHGHGRAIAHSTDAHRGQHVHQGV